MSKRHHLKRYLSFKYLIYTTSFFLVLTFWSTTCMSQIQVSYKYGQGIATDQVTDQIEHFISVGGGQRVKKLGGILYFDLTINIGTFSYLTAEQIDTKTEYGKTMLTLDFEYSFFSRRFQPLIGISAGYSGIGVKDNPDPDAYLHYLNGSPSAGIRFFLTKSIAIDGIYRQTFYFSKQPEAIDLNPAKLFSIGLKIGLFTK